MTHDYFTVAGMSLECRRIKGPADRPTLVFLHEGLGSVSLWRDFPSRLCHAAGLAGLVWSRQGYGRSDPYPPPWPVSFLEDEAALLPEVLAAAGIRQAILIGHSDGASIALIHAATAPAGILAVAVLAPHSFVEEITLAGIRAAGEAYRNGPLRSRLVRHHHANVDNAFWGWNGVWLNPGFRDWDIRGQLPGIRVPLLVIQGEGDEYGTAAQVEAIEAAVQGARIVMLEQCGHSPHRDREEDVVGEIRGWLTF